MSSLAFSLISRFCFPLRAKNFPDRSRREIARKSLNLRYNLAVAGQFKPILPNFPVFFPDIREMMSETGSHRIALPSQPASVSLVRVSAFRKKIRRHFRGLNVRRRTAPLTVSCSFSCSKVGSVRSIALRIRSPASLPSTSSSMGCRMRSTYRRCRHVAWTARVACRPQRYRSGR